MVSGRVALAAITALALGVTGCGRDVVVTQEATLEGPFAAVPRELNGSGASALKQALDSRALPSTVSANETFYVAINKNELGQKWFLSAYMSQLFPRITPMGISLGTRVVTFRVQNGKLFVFDADDRKASSTAADPEVIVEAYPIVSDYGPFTSLPNASQYVLFDPAAGLNRFGVVSDAFASPSDNGRFQVDLMFGRRFRKAEDGATFEQVFTGSSEVAFHNDPIEPSAFRFSGTIGIGLRRYAEGEGYEARGLSEVPYYFVSDPRLVKNGSTYAQNAMSWNIKPGMKPIVWKISRDVLELQKDPRFANYDLVASMKAGVENWNKAFGFKALEAQLASETDNAADDDTNYIYVDQDSSFGAAFANFRTNPNTGELRGSSIYFSALWLEIADFLFEDDAAPAPNLVQKVPGQGVSRKLSMLSWGDASDRMAPQVLCARAIPDLTQPREFKLPDFGKTALASRLTKKEKFERYIIHVLVHEVGHTLGLRHNFKGSLNGVSSSVMEYIDDLEALDNSEPGPYDTEAIKYLYHQSEQLPETYAFCTDDDVGVDVDCTTFDYTTDPLNQLYGPGYAQLRDAFLAGTGTVAPNSTLNNVLKYVRADPDQARQLAALNIVLTGIASPIDPAKLAQPTYGARADLLLRNALRRLYLDGEELRGLFVNDPSRTYNPELHTALFAQVKAVALNTDGNATYASQRVAISILQKYRDVPSYEVLKAMKAAVEAKLPTLTGTRQVEAEILLNQITAALSSYVI
ncbi:MAG: zinc-dependent metalloprotease [Myxococcaceae bacterium]